MSNNITLYTEILWKLADTTRVLYVCILTKYMIIKGRAYTSGIRRIIPLSPRREVLCQNPTNPNRISRMIKTHLFSTNMSTIPSNQRNVYEHTPRPGLY